MFYPVSHRPHKLFVKTLQGKNKLVFCSLCLVQCPCVSYQVNVSVQCIELNKSEDDLVLKYYFMQWKKQALCQSR